MFLIGIDFGLKNIGIAIADGPLAHPFSGVTRSQLFIYLDRIVSNNPVTKIVVGAGSPDLQPHLNNFLIKLSDRYRLPVEVVDETLSSKDALNSLMHTTKSRRRKLEHSASAAIILQSYLDSMARK